MNKHKCDNCDNITVNPRFCSRSCAAKITNKESPKRFPESNCLGCKKPVHTKIRYCKNCKFRGEDITLGQAIYVNVHKANAYSLVRNRARSKIKKLGITACSKCGYSKHIEVGHIKAICSFSEDILLSVINDMSNLIVLCPNCHWEFDHPE